LLKILILKDYKFCQILAILTNFSSIVTAVSENIGNSDHFGQKQFKQDMLEVLDRFAL
jgi:hypothetical protein